MFNLFREMPPYELRKVDNYTKGKVQVDTCLVTDSDQPYETGVCHPKYNSGNWVIVELYDTKEQAQQGHNKWVKLMTAKKLPKSLKDVSSADIAKLCEAVGSDFRKPIKIK